MAKRKVTTTNRWSIEEDLLVKVFYNRGIPVPEIANQLNRSKSAVYQRIHNMGGRAALRYPEPKLTFWQRFKRFLAK